MNNAKQVPRRPHSQRTTEKIVVKSGTTKYADLLKKVKDNVDLDKDNVDLDKVGVHVKTIKKTRHGDLMLEVSGDRERASALKAAISKKVENKVSVINNEMTIHVLDIDAAYTKEDAEEAIRNAAKVREPQTIRVKSMRPTRDGNQIATVQASRAAGNVLLNTGRIKIGWVGCRVRERIEVTRCYRCLEFGHLKKDCKGQDRSNHCLSCNQLGHQAKDCAGAQFCPSCQSEGHRADSTKCPRFRELLSQEKAKGTSKTRKAGVQIVTKNAT
ncbi:hypothetical protein QE152_g15951 [Popillia japonica]|uniref:CCHC-type domain-containing protein n=1 Tax=Popillia japonica TaxID=7064 RepID=A0AAW1L7S5_POPJA